MDDQPPHTHDFSRESGGFSLAAWQGRGMIMIWSDWLT